MNEAEILSTRPLHPGRVVRLFLDTVRLPNGNVTELEIVRHVGAAAVVPIDDERRVLLVRQYRHATGGWLLEIPAGKLDPGEDPARCAAREVEEETGHRASRLLPMGWIWSTPGFSDERIWLYLATGLETTRQTLEADEVLSVVRLPLDEAVARASRGEITDAKSVCALLRVPGVLPAALGHDGARR